MPVTSWTSRDKSISLEIQGLIVQMSVLIFNRKLGMYSYESPLSAESRVRRREGPDLRSVTLQNSTNSNWRVQKAEDPTSSLPFRAERIPFELP